MLKYCSFSLFFLSFLPISVPEIAIAQTQESAPALSEKEEDKTEWIDASTLKLEGKGWPNSSDQFGRLPQNAEGLVTKSVWSLSNNTAGIAVHFKTDSPKIQARWSGGGAMLHMPATGVSGLDLYRRNKMGEWKFAGVGKPLKGTTTATLTPDSLNLDKPEKGTEVEYLLFLPLYHSVAELKIGLDEGSSFEEIISDEKPVVFYGTSIVQGGCASRTGMCHAAILRRWLDREVINLGFSGAGKMEIEMADLLCEIDAAVYVIDCLPNMTMEMTEERIRPFLERMTMKKPDTPIVLVEHLLEVADERNAYLEEVFDWFSEIHPARISYIYRESFDGIENGTVDGIHPTDLGFLRMAEAMEDPIRNILEEK